MSLTLLSAPYRRLWSLVANDGVIPDLKGATPRRITRILRDAQLLESGRVTAVSILQTHVKARLLSARLELQFSQPVPAHVPRRVYLKLVTPQTIQLRGRHALHEWEFYTSVTTALTPSLNSMGVVRCLDAAVEPGGASHLVLHDLSETHTQPEWPIPPSQAQVERVVDWAAVFHGTWWEDPGLLDLPRPQVSLRWLTEIAERHLAAISHQLSAVELARTRRVHQAIPHLWALGTFGQPPARAYALTHGDLHWWNVLYPLTSTGSLAVIDWEDWNVGHPMTEIAYLVGLHWDRSRNPADERALIERYHNALVATGRPAYSWEDCWRDYRMGIIAMFLASALFQERQLAAAVWWPHVRRAHAAFEQLACDELLPSAG